MAGAGYKLFNTGDVLTAAQVNTYLMEQTVMVFANAAARTSALTGVVSEGMISYLKDTNAVEVYDGSNWVSSDDPNAIQNTIVDAKGDLIAASAADTPARLAVGNNGETLVADSSATTGLRWQGNFAAGKNKIINGDFGIWQRGTTQNLSSTSTTYLADRFSCYMDSNAGTFTYSRESFTAGTAPVAGYEGQYFARISTGGNANFGFGQPIEDVRTFAGQTITVSFWAKSSTAKTFNIGVYQEFGSGGSSLVTVGTSSYTTTTSWARYSATFSVPSISGKTIGTGNHLLIRLIAYHADTGNFTTDFWGVQVEAGNVATAFQTATGTLAGELAACQRYYYRTELSSDVYSAYAVGMSASAVDARCYIKHPVRMRVKATSIDAANLAVTDYVNYTTAATITLNSMNTDGGVVQATTTGMTQYRGAFIVNGNNTTGYIGFNAEL